MVKPLLRALSGQAQPRPPVWLRRQAGRYLPEYRATRARAGSFLDLCYNPALAAEVTLQPIRRYGLDAAILFSDILVVPHALGQALDYVEGEGPKLDPVTDAGGIDRLSAGRLHEVLGPVYETVGRVAAAGAGLLYERYFAGTGVDAVGLDTTVPPGWAARALQPKAAVQGNLNPVLLLTGGEAMIRAADAIVAALGRDPFVFNLGHGVLQKTPPEHVAALVRHLRGDKG
jgi:uroporphyrinogen-III decarboxylase